MDITSLEFECDSKGKPKIAVWAKCHSVDDVDDIIAWLHLAKAMMIKWDKIRNRHEKASRKAEASAGQDGDARKIQDQPQAAGGTDGPVAAQG